MNKQLDRPDVYQNMDHIDLEQQLEMETRSSIDSSSFIESILLHRKA